jgi:hypothetical protein
MRSKFKQLCKTAGVTIDGDPATPKHGRAFYYNVFAAAETELLAAAGEVAEEQGSKDAESVLEHYFTKQNRQQYRRIFFRQRIRQILPEDAYTAQITDSNSSLDDFR